MLRENRVEAIAKAVKSASEYSSDYEDHWGRVLPALQAELERLTKVNPESVIGVTKTSRDAVAAAVTLREHGWKISDGIAAGQAMSGRILIGSVFVEKDWSRETFNNDESQNVEELRAAADAAEVSQPDDQWLIWVGDKDPNYSEFASELVGWSKWLVF